MNTESRTFEAKGISFSPHGLHLSGETENFLDLSYSGSMLSGCKIPLNSPDSVVYEREGVRIIIQQLHSTATPQRFTNSSFTSLNNETGINRQ